MYFADFAQEKEYARSHSMLGSSPWGHIPPPHTTNGIDADILPFVIAVNALPYAYTKGMCCSGSRNDHNGKDVCHVNDFGVDRSSPQGYAILRLNKSHAQYPAFLEKLLLVSNASLNDIGAHMDTDTNGQMGVATKAYQMFVQKGDLSDALRFQWQELAMAIMADNLEYLAR